MTTLNLSKRALFFLCIASALGASEKRIADWKQGILSEITKTRSAHDLKLINQAEQLFIHVTRAEQITYAERYFLQKIARKDIYGPLLEHLLKMPLFTQKDFQETKDILLYTVIDVKGFNPKPYENIKILLRHGATLSHAQKQYNDFFSQYIARELPMLACFAAHYPDQKFRTECYKLLKDAKRGGSDGSRIREQANTLFFYGFNVPKHCSYCELKDFSRFLGPEVCGFCESPTQKAFFDHVHPRRVARLASYLTRCTSLVKDITLLIAQYRYGRLSQEDREKISLYPTDGHKKIRPKLTRPSANT